MGLQAHELVVIYLDVNGTIMAADQAQGKTTQDYVNIEFAKHIKGIWQQHGQEMSFREFVETQVLKGNGAERRIKDARNTIYKNFMTSEYAHDHPDIDSLRAEHKRYTDIAQAMDNLLFPSFWHLVDWAQDKPYVRLVFRTFGHDIPDIKEILATRGYQMSNIMAYDEQGHLIQDGQVVDVSQMWRDPFNAVHDNHKRWHENGESESFAKPFAQPEKGVGIFFDDNAKVKHIIAPGNGATRNQLLESGHIVAVRTLQALTDPDYFIGYVDKIMKDG